MLRKLLRVATIFLKEDEFMAWFLANWQNVDCGVLGYRRSGCYVSSRQAQGTVKTLAGVMALAGLGVKDPQIGK
jgi:hypothetical protein